MSTTLADALAGLEAPSNFWPRPAATHAGARDRASNGRELSVWLTALLSFFDLKNHPLGESERAEICARNFIHEARVAQQVLRRCLLLALSAAPEEGGDFGAIGEGSFNATEAPHASRPDNVRDAPATGELLPALSDLCTLCDGLVESPAVSLSAWEGFGGVVKRELGRPEVAPAFAPPSPRQILRDSHSELLGMAERISPPALAADVLASLSLLALSLQQLELIGTLLAGDRPLKQTLPVFTLVRSQARALTSMIEIRALVACEGRREVYESLDSAAYALGMELNKVYTHELVGLAASRHAPTVYAKVENAFGLLRDCFQQTLITLAHLFEPDFEPSRLFSNVQSKLEQSLALRGDLWELLGLVRRAERERDRRPLAPLVERLRAFQTGSMRHLMFKDWESFERFVAEVGAARGAIELGPVLHRFATYLEALFGQINMRAALAEHPFEYPQAGD